MRKSVLVLILISLVSNTFAQKKKKNEKTEPAKQEEVAPQPQPVKAEVAPKKDSVPTINPLIRHYAIKYQVALQWNDPDVAKSALYDLIIENQGNDSLIYELAYFYYQNQKYPSAVLVSQELLKRNPKNTSALEMSAIGYESLGVFDRSLQNYESLFLLQSNPNVLYKMAFLQLRLKRYKESATSSDILLADKKIDELKVSYTGTDNKTKEYPMRAAILNLKGMVSQEQGDKVTARKFYEQSLALAADFPPAKENLTKLK